MADGSWTDDENDAIVADYFAMLADDLLGRSYIKAEHNRALQAMTGRSKGSIEFKHANISAALRAFGQPILQGYLPRFNFQMSLAEAIDRWLTANPDWIERLPEAPARGMAFAPGLLFIDTPPKLPMASRPACQSCVTGFDQCGPVFPQDAKQMHCILLAVAITMTGRSHESDYRHSPRRAVGGNSNRW
jgi:hypothetical protein